MFTQDASSQNLPIDSISSIRSKILNHAMQREYDKVVSNLVDFSKSETFSAEDKVQLIGNIIAAVLFANAQYEHIISLIYQIDPTYLGLQARFHIAITYLKLAETAPQNKIYFIYTQILAILRPMTLKYADIRLAEMSINVLALLGNFQAIDRFLRETLENAEADEDYKISSLKYASQKLVASKKYLLVINLLGDLPDNLITTELRIIYARACFLYADFDKQNAEMYLDKAFNAVHPRSKCFFGADMIEVCLDCCLRLDSLEQIKEIMFFVLDSHQGMNNHIKQIFLEKILTYLLAKQEYQFIVNVIFPNESLSHRSLLIIADAHRILSTAQTYGEQLQSLQAIAHNKFDEMSYHHREALRTLQKIPNWSRQFEFTLCAAKLYYGIASGIATNDLSIIDQKYICFETALTIMSKYLTVNCQFNQEFQWLYKNCAIAAKGELLSLNIIGLNNHKISKKLAILNTKIASAAMVSVTRGMGVFDTFSLNNGSKSMLYDNDLAEELESAYTP